VVVVVGEIGGGLLDTVDVLSGTGCDLGGAVVATAVVGT
jgi:hypothetical protein